MPAGLLLGLVASLSWGFTDLSAALGSRRVGSLRVLAGTQVVSLSLLVLVALANPSRLAGEASAGMVAGLVLGLGGALAYLASFTALRIGPLSVVSPVIAAYGGVTVVLAILLRGETLHPAQAIGAVVATAGVILAALVFHGGSLRGARVVGPGVLVAIVALSLFALLTVGLAGPIKAHGWLPVILGSRISNASMSTLLLVIGLRARSPRLGPLLEPSGALNRRSIALMAAAGASDMIGFVAYSAGLEVSYTWLVGLASSFGPVIPLLFAVGVLGERLRPTQWLGLALIAVGLVELAVAG
jgi:drug/metabolite transporter (DMT)-like permease